MDLKGEIDNLGLAGSGEEEPGRDLTNDELSAEFNAMISETSPVDVETDDLHEADWIFDVGDSENSSEETLPEMQSILENEYVI